MIEGKSPSFQYLTRDAVAKIHVALSAWAIQNGDEPIPPVPHAKTGEIDALVDIPQRRFDGRDMYPTLEEKAAILFYSVNKQQIFLNGNKRMSTLCLLVFLGINGKWLSVPSDQLTAKALWLANTPSLDFPVIKKELADWIRSHMVDYPEEKIAA